MKKSGIPDLNKDKKMPKTWHKEHAKHSQSVSDYNSKCSHNSDARILMLYFSSHAHQYVIH